MIKTPFLLFLGDTSDLVHAKTAIGIRHWRPEAVVGQARMTGCPIDLGVPELAIRSAVDAGAGTLVVGVSPPGGSLPAHWLPELVLALESGLDIASGLHTRLADVPELRDAAERGGCEIHDVRFPSRRFDVGTGLPRRGRRLLTVGTDCSVGKMYTTLALERALRTAGVDAQFRATGQTGILISGSGVSVDAVVADFVSGASEWLSPDNDDDHWDLIEGQGSLFHPSYAGVSLGLLHGSQPDAIVVCHEAGRQNIAGLRGYPVPSVADCIELNLGLGRLCNPAIRCVGVSVNTSALEEPAATDYLDRLGQELGLPCVDVVRTGVAPIVEQLLQRGVGA
jgi:uncharacterized NAD-dependent epimerase/dehydratase family protein